MGIRRLKQSGGFTLLELMMAMLVFGLLLSLIYGLWRTILRITYVGQLSSDVSQRLRISSLALETALSCAVLYEQNLDLYAFFADTSKDFPVLSFCSRLPLTFPGSGFFHGLQLRRVTFRVVAETNQNPTLVLYQWPINALPPQSDQVGPPYRIKLCEAVEAFKVEFSDGRADQWLPEWVNPVTKEPWTNQLPYAVRFLLALKPDSDQQAKLVMRTVLIASRPVRRLYQGIIATPRVAPSEAVVPR